MSETPNTNDHSPGVIAIWQGSSYAKWMCPVASEWSADDPWSGYLDVNADARNRAVEIAELCLTPDEARAYAQAVLAAADHAEQHANRRIELLSDLSCSWPELGEQPAETQRLIRDLLRSTTDRIRRDDVTRRSAGTS